MLPEFKSSNAQTRMSPDEVMATIVSVLLALLTWTWTLVRMATFPSPAGSAGGKALVALAFPTTLVVLFAVLRTMASHDVVNAPQYIFMYCVMGAAWVGVLGQSALPGISLRDDLLERGNKSAGIAIAGFIVGAGLCFTGGNIGDGPGWWVVVFSGGLATFTLSLLWWILNGYTQVADHITIDRDPAIGLRIAGYFIGTGLILGRSAAGDWVSAGTTLQDFFRHMWPSLILTLFAIVFERRARPQYGEKINPVTRGGLPAIAYILGGMIGAAITGPIE